MQRELKKNFILAIVLVLVLSASLPSISADTQNTTKPAVQQKQNVFKRIFKRNNKPKKQKVKKARVEEMHLPPVIQGKPNIPFSQMPVMTIDDCVKYAYEHNPSFKTGYARIDAAKAGIGIARSAYAPSFSARFGYNHANTHTDTRISTTDTNSYGVSLGVSETIWDFGRTTARINMAKYDALATEYDENYLTLNVVYAVRTSYYKVLSALANLDIYEQNVRIQTLNFERTKAMFDEGLKSKIDVVNAEVNLADSKIQLVQGQDALISAIIELQNNMYYQEDKPFVVKNTENFGFLKADYKKKIENASSSNQPKTILKRDDDGLITLSSGIEHNDILQDYKLNPMKLTKQQAVDKALDLRPDLKMKEMLVNVQDESLKAIRRQYAPALNGELSWGYTKYDNSYSSPLQVGANIGVGAVNPYGIHYQIKQGEHLLDLAKYNYNMIKADIYWQVQDNYVEMRQLERKIPLMNTKVRATLENFKLADGRYAVGLSNYVELQDALTNYNTAQLNFVEAVFDYNVAREKLLWSMGIEIGKSAKKSDASGSKEVKWDENI